MSSDCIFCMIGVESIKSEILYNNDTCFVIRDIDPKAPIHLLVIPYKHFGDLTNFTSDFYETICGIFEAIKNIALQMQIKDSGYRIVINQGSNAGQQVEHLQIHILAGKPLSTMG